MEYYDKHYNGYFWIENYSENGVPATLYIDIEGKAFIETYKELIVESDAQIHKEWFREKTVYGFIHFKHKSYSIKLFSTRTTACSHGRINRYQYSSSKVFITEKIDEEIEEKNYTCLMLGGKQLDDWVPITGFTNKVPDSEGFCISQNYNQPEIIELYEDVNLNIYIYFRAISGLKERRETYIKEYVFINVEVTNKKCIEEIERIQTSIERLLNLLLARPFKLASLEYRSASGVTYKSLSKRECIKSLKRYCVDFDKFLKNSQEIVFLWLENQDSMNLMIQNFFSVFGERGVLAENKFLSYISCLENYHANNVQERLNLKYRLEYLLENSSIQSKINDISSFATKLKISRNYYTHLEEKRETNSYSTTELIQINLVLEVVILELLLSKINITDLNHFKVITPKAIRIINDNKNNISELQQ